MSINFTQNKTATASSYVFPYAPSRAVNGTNYATSRWLCNKMPATLMVNLGGFYYINRWVVYGLGSASVSGTSKWNQNNNLNSYSLQISTDGANWVTVDTVSGNTANSTDRTLTRYFKAAFVRLCVTQGLNNNPTYSSVTEFQVWGDLPTSSLLTQLSISAGALTPAFSSTIASYTSTVPFETTSTTVTATSQDPAARITVNGVSITNGGTSAPIPLNTGSNTITVTVTPVIGDPQNYTVTVTRQDSSYLTNLVVKDSAGNVILMDPAFVKTTLGYSGMVDYSVNSITVTPTAESSSASITVNGQNVTSGQPQAITLNVGTNIIPVVVTSSAGTQTYSITVTRRANLYLSNLVLKVVLTSIQMNPNFATNIYKYTASVAGGKASITVVPTLAAGTSAVITVNGGAPVSSGSSVSVSLDNVAPLTNIINVVLTDATGTNTYTVEVTRPS